MSLNKIGQQIDQFQRANGIRDEDLNNPLSMFALALVDKNGIVVLDPNNLAKARTNLFAAGNPFNNYAEVTLSKAQILALFATPVTLVPAQGADKAIEFISGVVIYDFATAAYTGGGALSIAWAGGADVAQTISAANSFGAAGDKVTQASMLDTANGIPLLANTALVIKNATGAFVDPGTAAGVGRVKIAYRVHTLGLA